VPELAVFGVVLVAFGLVSKRLDGSPVTAPMVFAAAGLLVGAAGGSLEPGIELDGGHVSLTETARHAAEIALVLLLFADAARIDLTALRSSSSLPLRLLVVGLPLSIVLGGLVAAGLFSGTFGLWEAMLVGAILAPTDAALGAVVVSSPKLPQRLRQALNVEAGLNDGLAVPFFTVFAVLAVEAAEGRPSFVRVAFEKIGYGAAVGVALGLLGGWLGREAARRGWVLPPFGQLGALALAVLAWWTAEELGGSGLIAAFVGGMAFGAAARALEAEVVRFAEDLGQLLSLLVFFALGVVAFDVLDAVTWKMCLYTVLTLTAIRMLPVAVALAGTGLRPWTVVYLGWFGPRGLASVVLALILLIEYPGIPGVGALELTVLLTVLVSVFAHGASAAPLTARFARLPYLGDEAAPERAAAVDVRVRR
jgi:NhaP-type Na+/H+ or K+/H+ antiporter